MNGTCCETCRYWDDLLHRNDEGVCRRYPPVLSDYALRFYTENPGGDEDHEEAYLVRASHSLNVCFQPTTHSSDTCGEYAPAPAPSGAGSPSV